MLDAEIKGLIKNLDGQCSIIVSNVTYGEKFAFNEDTVFPAASLIKLWILWALYKNASMRKVDLDEEIILSEEYKTGGFGVLQYMHAGLNITLRDCATLMIILSDNTATNILIDYLGIEKINNEIRRLGMQKTALQRKMMDAEAKARGLDNFTSAQDVHSILAAILDSPEMPSKFRQEMLDILLKQQCNNKLPLLLPEGVLFAHKTGDLPNIEHDAGILFLNDAKIIIVVAVYGVKNNLDGIRFHNQFGYLVYNYYKQR